MATLWMRLGVTISLSDDEVDILRHHKTLSANDKAKEIILKACKEGRVELDGESYVPMENEPDLDYYF